MDKVAIVGLGLIGGSLARDLAALGHEVHAYDADASQLTAALRTNVIHGALDASLDGTRDAKIIIIAVPVDASIDVLRRVAGSAKHASLIMDVGSTKTRIVSAATEFGLNDRFIGAHPLAGDHRSGWNASRAGLFVDAPVYLCPPKDAGESLALARDFWKRLGAKPEAIPSAEHDLRLAWTSHFPQLVSTTLALALARAGVSRDLLGPGGRDVTRLAGSSPELWTGIAIENADALSDALERMENELATMRSVLERGDSDGLRKRLTAARQWFADSGNRT